jgi:hypothetical protein
LLTFETAPFFCERTVYSAVYNYKRLDPDAIALHTATC